MVFVSMAAVYQLKIKDDQDKFKAVFRRMAAGYELKIKQSEKNLKRFFQTHSTDRKRGKLSS